MGIVGWICPDRSYFKALFGQPRNRRKMAGGYPFADSRFGAKAR
jgi:hypothetical protein